jgi:hypothetical protein
MSTTTVALVIAAAGIAAVLAMSYVFYLVGRSEDRDREAVAAARRAAEPPPEREPDHTVAEERRRPLPPRRPE